MKNEMIHFNLELEKAESGDYGSMVAVAIAYASGIGVDMDHERRDFWLGKATNCQKPEILAVLGELYDEGRFVEKDETKSVQLYMDAYGLDRRLGGYALGKHHYSRFMVGHDNHDLVEAHRYWMEAEKAGHFTSWVSRLLLEMREHFGAVRRLKARMKWIRLMLSIRTHLGKDDLFFRFWRIDDLRDRFPKLCQIVDRRLSQR
ncbi:MAG: sel1 repeat family protein [Ectothiorhodospiraceae bacterium]|nr:sel1 repeat family protein [Ectothiorhodospiraceae bacterium]